MLSTIKSFILGFVKSEVVNNLGLLDTLAGPQLAALLTAKANLPQAQAQALAADVMAIVKTEITNLLNKI